MTATLVHPAAEAFPLMSDDDLNALAVDIAANGLNDPIVTDSDGAVIDGRNRLEACRRVKVDPTFTTFDGDAFALTRSKNLWRRNMTTGQRAAACALSLIGEGKRGDGRWKRGSVPDANGDTAQSSSNEWPHSMAKAGLIADWKPELLPEVRDGKRALDAAYKAAKTAQDKAAFDKEQERKKREGELAAADAELARLLSLWHNTLNVDWTLLEDAQDADSWQGVVNLADQIIGRATKLKEQAHERLA